MPGTIAVLLEDSSNNYFDKFSFNINFIKHGENSDRLSGTNQINEGLSQRGPVQSPNEWLCLRHQY